MTLNQLVYFQTIAKLLNFRQAAEELNVAQPTLSVAIANLEKELGIYLFQRDGHYIRLTKYGKIYQEQINDVLNRLDSCTEQIKRLSNVATGHIDVGYISTLTRRFIPWNVRKFLEKPGNQEIRFNFNEGSTFPLVQGLKEQKYDVIFGPTVPAESDITFFPILYQKFVAIVPPEHPLAINDTIMLKDLAPYPFIAYMKNSGLKKTVDHYIQESGWAPQVYCAASDETGIASLVESNFGVSFVAQVESLDTFHIKQIPIRQPLCQRTLYMAYLTNQYHAPAVWSFINFIKNERLSIPNTSITPYT